MTNLGGTSTTSIADLFTYAPTVSGLNPAFGPSAGGTLVTITGTGFTGATAVDFGTSPAPSFTIVSTTSITAASPTGGGSVNVTVTTPAGTSAVSPADVFTYAPTVTGVSPISGSVFGGFLVVITGTNLANATGVHFGTAAVATGISDTATQLEVVSPAGATSAPWT